jgi:hypothetical protein
LVLRYRAWTPGPESRRQHSLTDNPYPLIPLVYADCCSEGASTSLSLRI